MTGHQGEGNFPSPSDRDRGNGAAQARQINALLGVVLAGLDVPLPASQQGNLDYYRLLDARCMWIRGILRRVVDRGVAAADLPFETAALRGMLRRYPPGYRVAPERPDGAPGGWPAG